MSYLFFDCVQLGVKWDLEDEFFGLLLGCVFEQGCSGYELSFVYLLFD